MTDTWVDNLATEGNSIDDLHARAYTIAVPAGHYAIIVPISDDASDAGAQIIDHAEALHRVHELLESGEDG